MKSFSRIAAVLLLTLGLSGEGFAQQPVYDLATCIDMAVQNNIGLKVAKLGISMQENNLWQARTAMLPTLNANASHGYNWGQTIDLYTNQFASERVQTNNFYLQSGVTLFNGFRLLNLAAQQHATLMAKRYECDKTLNDIILNVATAYLQVLYSSEQLAVAKGQLTITLQQVKRMSQMVEEGMRPKGELLTLEAQLASEEASVVRAENTLDMAYLTLSQLMNIQQGTSFSVMKPAESEGSVSETVLLSPVEIFNYANDHLPQLKSAEMGVKGADAGLKAAQGGVWPSLHLSASMGTGFSGARKDYSYTLAGFQPNGMFTSGLDTVYAPVLDVNESLRPFGKQLNDNFNQSVALYLTIPLFNNLQTHTAVKNAELTLANARYNLEMQQQQLMQEIQQAHADAAGALKSWEAAKKSWEALKESFLYAEERYNVGMISSLEFNEAKNRLMATESQMIGARYEYIFKTKLLDFYMGKEISL